MATLTAANSFFTLNIPTVFSTPQVMFGYGVDDAFETEAVTVAQIIKGVDALKSQGYVPYNIPFKFYLQADSPSIPNTMDIWVAYEQQQRETQPVSATIILPGVLKIITLNNGTMKTAMIMPTVKKILQQQTYELEFDTATVGPYST